MQSVVHLAESRGHANHGWLDTYHTFSFAEYHNPDRMAFGVLRVLNDDTVSGGRGFGKHPHSNMEIISIPLEGDLVHMDSMENIATIKEGDVQVMSAGTGVMHSEHNKNGDKDVKFLQIWVIPNKMDVEPRYDQLAIRDIEKKNSFFQILSPSSDDSGVWIHQNAWFNMGRFDEGVASSYQMHDPGHGLYVFVIEGEVDVEGQKLSKRDGFGIWDTEEVKLKSLSGSQVLLMEVPLQVNRN